MWMALIYYFSSQVADASDELSSGLLDVLLRIINYILPSNQLNPMNFHRFIRKSAHFSVYLILGILVLNALRRSRITGIKSAIIGIIICVLYAISDEMHQLMVPGRSGEIMDVLIDSIGVNIGIWTYMLISHIKHHKSNKYTFV